jgi:hypothetical protein
MLLYDVTICEISWLQHDPPEQSRNGLHPCTMYMKQMGVMTLQLSDSAQTVIVLEGIPPNGWLHCLDRSQCIVL